MWFERHTDTLTKGKTKSAHKSERPDKIFGYENIGKLPFAASVFRMVIQLLLP